MSHVHNIPVTPLPAQAPLQEVATPGPAEVVAAPPFSGRRTGAPRHGRQTVPPEQAGGQPQLTPAQRLLVLDTWMKSKFKDMHRLS